MVDKDWSEARALAEQEEWNASHGRPDPFNMKQPYPQWRALHELDALMKRFETGDRLALFNAVYICADHGLAMPEWVELAFGEGYCKVRDYKSRSWDDAFGSPYPKNFKLKQARDRKLIQHDVLFAVGDAILKEGVAVSEELWRAVGEGRGLGEGLVKKIWYSKDKFPTLYRESVMEEAQQMKRVARKNPRKS